MLYALDMRPVLCGITWGVADEGRVQVAPILRRFRTLCPVGYQPVLHGGTRQDPPLFPVRLVEPGTVLTLLFAPIPPAVFEDDAADSDGDSAYGPGPSDDDDNSPPAGSLHQAADPATSVATTGSGGPTQGQRPSGPATLGLCQRACSARARVPVSALCCCPCWEYYSHGCRSSPPICSCRPCGWDMAAQGL